MDARTDIEARLPSRHVTEAPEGAPHRSHDAHLVAREPMPRGVAEAFKRTLYIADSKPGGRYVAKDMVEFASIPLLTKTLLDHGDLHGACMTVAGRTIAENPKSVTWNPDQRVVCAEGVADAAP
jgi:dihydroxyacid dehydratase/phosphogluconate dehydratase